MARTPRKDLERELRDPEYAKLYGAADAKAEFAVTLARARRKAKITQKELAHRLGLRQPYIAKLEGGDANPTLGTAGSLLAVLGLRLVMDAEPLLSDRMVPTTVPSADMGAPGIDIPGTAVEGISILPLERGMVARSDTSLIIQVGATTGRQEITTASSLN